MELKLSRVIRGCAEMDYNPVMAIHDQGAGGYGKFVLEYFIVIRC